MNLPKPNLQKRLLIIGLLIIGGEIFSLIFASLYYFLTDYQIAKNNALFYQKVSQDYQLLVETQRKENESLKWQIEQQKEAVSDLNSHLSSLTENVNQIVKLENLDKELLKKYSKVYFLNENYVPQSLTKIDSKYVDNTKDQYILTNVWPFLSALLSQAQKDGIDLKIRWGYRSFFEQYQLKSADVMTFGSGANKFTADQGYSEHQLGTTVDFTTSEFNGTNSKFNKTKAYQWLLNNAYKYGFILSYPENNEYYIYEPWHWRFVGIKLATKLHNENKFFYDLDQREIDQYLISIFDWQ